MPPVARWQAMVPADIPAATALSLIALGPSFAESESIFADRLALSPQGCFSCIAADGTLVGYSIAHPWRRAQPPALNSLLPALPATPDCWYIHDTALDASLRGQGLAATMLALQEAQAHAHGLPLLALVAVGGAAVYWQRQGFTDAMSPALTAKLASYGTDALYMEKPLAL